MTEEKKKAPAAKSGAKTARKSTSATKSASTAKTTAAARKSPARKPAAKSTAAKGGTKAPEQVIKIDGQDYPVSRLSDNARAQILNLQATDQRIEHLQRELAITQTARKAYAEALSSELGAASDVTLQ